MSEQQEKRRGAWVPDALTVTIPIVRQIDLMILRTVLWAFYVMPLNLILTETDQVWGNCGLL